MLAIADRDIRPFDSFPLAWRWNDDPSSPIPESLRCLTESKAGEIWVSLSSHIEVDRLSSPRFSIVSTYETASDVAASRVWLQELQVPAQTIVVVSWGPDTAVCLLWSVFLEHWDDFCYPSSDDVLVAPFDLDWLLAFWHFERFEYAEPAS